MFMLSMTGAGEIKAEAFAWNENLFFIRAKVCVPLVGGVLIKYI